MPPATRILGIDPGVATTGLGLVEMDEKRALCVLDWLTISTKPGPTLAERLCEIRNDLKEYIMKTKPDLAVVERLFFSKNEKTAFDVAHARGVVLLTLSENEIPFLEPNPMTLKSCITGDGRADKRQVQDMLLKILGLKEIPRPDDAADALALAVFGALNRTTPNLR
ncbi:MAG: crossover junction endodeoxyribonuclease RuvC [Candidatus Peribacteraceae bacterium]|nr:crossover junction endodeoxyribonuclease RuvC [Candidatus Peribacteraceae bacterium]MDD5074996.1 crossover junction endodeoxyribonuclease RuvC [Candidatus Peribacteraceae bacterium]